MKGSVVMQSKPLTVSSVKNQPYDVWLMTLTIMMMIVVCPGGPVSPFSPLPPAYSWENYTTMNNLSDYY